MIDIKFLRENPEIVRENIRKKFQEHKLPLVDEAIELDSAFRAAIKEADELRASRNKISKQIGALMAQGKKDEAEEAKKQVAANAARLAELEEIERELEEKLKTVMMTIPQIIDPSVPIGKDDSENVEVENSVSRLCPILRFPIIPKSWKPLTELTLTAQERLQETDFTTLWEILPVSIRLSFHTLATL